MWNWNKINAKEYIMSLFPEKVAGKEAVDIGNRIYYMPINYVTDENNFGMVVDVSKMNPDK